VKKIDINGFLGRWGIRSQGVASPDEFLSALKRHDIQLAVVTSTVALVTDTKAGNQWLINKLTENSRSLKPAICVNPYWGEKDYLPYFETGNPLVRLFPALHNYSLQNEKLLAPLLSCLEQQQKPLILLTVGVTPHFALMAPVIGFNPAVPWPEIIAFTLRHPKMKIVIAGSDPEYFQVEELADMLKANPGLYLETSCWSQAGLLEKFCQLECAHKIIFGSAYGILDMGAAVEKINLSALTEAEKRKVFGENAAGLLSASEK
jgi:predicted TIM-barrel fold metal-dependent hydrolase